MTKRMKRLTASALACAACAAVSLTAAAQPDPFADYEAMKRGQTPPPPPAASLPAAQPIPSPEPEIPTAPWKWSFGGRSAFSYTGISNDTLLAQEQSNTTLFFRLTPTVGLTVYERVLVSASFGLLGNNLTREDGSNATSVAALLEFTGHYILPVTRRLAFLPGLGIGPYFGSNDRKLRLPDGRKVDEASSTVGVAMSMYGMFGYQVSPNLSVRTGIALYSLFQTERVESASKSLGASAVHVGLPIELHFHVL
ncbi:hypothetical protein [Polyangium fumosum]|uniref:hypothetical protein n=1 Tax=Polyangium fumosum TaxID=889272 RepID=UPI0014797E3C|nr:hypothetical protein [Polyangium fumosum]